MTQIHISDAKRLRFPGRSDEFAEGVEIGVVAVLMDLPLPEFTRTMSTANVVQARALAAKMGFETRDLARGDGTSQVTFFVRRGPPGGARRLGRGGLRLVHSAGDSPPA